MKLTLNTKDKIMKFNVLFQNLKAFTEYINLYVSKDGIYIQGMDPSQCSCFECKLANNWFDSYNYELENEKETVGINTIILQKILGIYVDTQTLEISVDNNADNLYISFVNGDNIIDKYFEIPLVEIDSELLDIKSDESNVDLTVVSKDYCDLINQLYIFNDALSLEFDESSVNFLAKGSDGTMKVNINLDDFVEYAIEEDFQLKQTYNIRHITLICLFSKLNQHCIMKYSDDRPMEAKYNLENDSYVVFYLAPKIVD
tara:strand:+ start:2761 stop:3534 length:774 start_codon:yes stop_codon:yes gene_type:complete